MSTFFNDLIYSELERSVTPDKTRKFTQYVQQFMDKNSEVLSHNIPSKRLFFYPKDMEYPFNNFGITIDDEVCTERTGGMGSTNKKN